jgi:hypothetical protein
MKRQENQSLRMAQPTATARIVFFNWKWCFPKKQNPPLIELRMGKKLL